LKKEALASDEKRILSIDRLAGSQELCLATTPAVGEAKCCSA
jgi:hypothetical protein